MYTNRPGKVLQHWLLGGDDTTVD